MVVAPRDAIIPLENCSEGPSEGLASKQTARVEPQRVYLQND